MGKIQGVCIFVFVLRRRLTGRRNSKEDNYGALRRAAFGMSLVFCYIHEFSPAACFEEK